MSNSSALRTQEASFVPTENAAPPVVARVGMRDPFPAHQISKLPKETGKQATERKKAQEAGNWPPKCTVCGGYHHAKAVHLDYVGHAALTDRLLDVDPEWSWEPVAFGADGLPAIDRNGGLWIRLTVGGVTRLGYGAADGKSGGDAIKEIIGDALRNAAMRFGAALDLWHKGDLHVAETEDEAEKPKADDKPDPVTTLASRADVLVAALNATETVADVDRVLAKGAKLCADLDLQDPEKLAAITTLADARRDELDATPFGKAA